MPYDITSYIIFAGDLKVKAKITVNPFKCKYLCLFHKVTLFVGTVSPITYTSDTVTIDTLEIMSDCDTLGNTLSRDSDFPTASSALAELSDKTF